MRLKDGVHPHGIEPALLLGLMIAESVWRDLGLPELVITSLVDGEHSTTSLHHAGQAADLSTHDLRPDQIGQAVAEVKRRLGRHYDVAVENDHLHLEYQPPTWWSRTTICTSRGDRHDRSPHHAAHGAAG